MIEQGLGFERNLLLLVILFFLTTLIIRFNLLNYCTG